MIPQLAANNFPKKLSEYNRKTLHLWEYKIIFDANTETWKLVCSHNDGEIECMLEIGSDETFWYILSQYLTEDNLKAIQEEITNVNSK